MCKKCVCEPVGERITKRHDEREVSHSRDVRERVRVQQKRIHANLQRVLLQDLKTAR